MAKYFWRNDHWRQHRATTGWIQQRAPAKDEHLQQQKERHTTELSNQRGHKMEIMLKNSMKILQSSRQIDMPDVSASSNCNHSTISTRHHTELPKDQCRNQSRYRQRTNIREWQQAKTRCHYSWWHWCSEVDTVGGICQQTGRGLLLHTQQFCRKRIPREEIPVDA